MADNEETDVETVDPQEAFIDRMAATFEKQDQAALDREDGIGSEDEPDEEVGGEEEVPNDTDDGTDEHTELDTSTETPDGEAVESDKDSEAGKDAEHPKGDEPDDSNDEPTTDGDAEKDEIDDEGDDEPLSEEFTEAAARLGIPLTLEDIPEGPARHLVEQKLRNMDSSFTRAMQDLRKYRTDEVQFRAEERYRRENPDLVIAEMLRADPTLIDRVNARTDKLEDPDNVAAFEIVIKDKRTKAAEAVQTEIDKDQHLMGRAQHVETLAKRISAKQGLPWEFAESAVERALLRLPEDKRDLTDEQVAEIVNAEATNYTRHVRAHRREASKKVIQDRTANRRVIPGAKHPTSATTPRPTVRKKVTEPKTEDERIARMMESARRIKPGARDE